MCLLKKLKLLKPSDKKKPSKEAGKNKRIKKNFKLRRREARRRRRAKRRMNKIMKFKFDEETLNKVKDNVLSLLNNPNENESLKKFNKINLSISNKFSKATENKTVIQHPSSIRIMGNIREVKAPLIGKRSDINKGVDTTDEELEEDGFIKKQGKGKACCEGGNGCCSWQKYKKKYTGVNNFYLYDICPVKVWDLSQDRKGVGSFSAQLKKKQGKLFQNIKIH